MLLARFPNLIFPYLASAHAVHPATVLGVAPEHRHKFLACGTLEGVAHVIMHQRCGVVVVPAEYAPLALRTPFVEQVWTIAAPEQYEQAVARLLDE